MVIQRYILKTNATKEALFEDENEYENDIDITLVKYKEKDKTRPSEATEEAKKRKE